MGRKQTLFLDDLPLLTRRKMELTWSRLSRTLPMLDHDLGQLVLEQKTEQRVALNWRIRTKVELDFEAVNTDWELMSDKDWETSLAQIVDRCLAEVLVGSCS